MAEDSKRSALWDVHLRRRASGTPRALLAVEGGTMVLDRKLSRRRLLQAGAAGATAAFNLNWIEFGGAGISIP